MEADFTVPALSSPARSAPAEPPAITVPERDLRLLLGGFRDWYRKSFGLRVAGETTLAGGVRGREGDFPGCLGILSGGPGMGKALLIQVLGQGCASLGVPFIASRCYRRVGEPLEPVLRLLEQLLGHLRNPPAAGSAPAAAALSREDLPASAWRLLAELLPDLFEEKPPPLPDLGFELNRSRMVDLLAEALVAGARRGPLMIAVEDVQWLDDPSRDVLAACLRLVRLRRRDPQPPRLLAVVTCQPDEIPSGKEWEELLHPDLHAFTIDLRGYSREDLVEACRNARGEVLPLAQRELLFQSTGGNPLFSRWALSHLALAGGSGESRGLDFLTSGYDLGSLLRAAFQALGTAEKGIVELLSFLVNPHTPAEIARLAAALDEPYPGAIRGLSPENLQQTLARLEAAGWLAREDAGGGEWRWGLEGAEIGVILENQRQPLRAREIHGRIGRLLLEISAGSRSPRWCEIFHHLRRDPLSPALLDIGEQALKEAEARHDTGRALSLGREILDLLASEDSGRRSRVLSEHARFLETFGRHRESIRIYQDLLAGKVQPLDAETRARYCRLIGNLHGKLGQGDQGVRFLLDGLKQVESSASSIERLKILAQLANLSLAAGDVEGSDRYLAGSREILSREEILQDSEFLEIHRLMEEVIYRRGDYVEAMRFEEAIFKRCEERGDHTGLIRSAEHLGQLHLRRGDDRRARELLELALEKSRECGSRFLEARVRAEIGRFLRGQGNCEGALEMFLAGRSILTEIGLEGAARQLQGLILHLQLYLKRLHDGLATLREYLHHAGAVSARGASSPVFPPGSGSSEERAGEIARLRQRLAKKPGESGDDQRFLGDLLLDHGEPDEAQRFYHEALRAPGAQRDPAAAGLLFQKLARWHVRRGERAQALEFLEKSLLKLGLIPDKTLLGNAYVEVGGILVVEGDLRKAYDYLLKGLRIFIEMEQSEGELLALLGLADFFRECGRRDLCVRICRPAASLARRCGHRRWQAEAFRLLGAMASESRDFPQSRKMFARARSLLQALGLQRELARLDLEAGWECVRLKEFTSGLARARKCLETARKLDDRDLLNDAFHLLGVVESALANRGKNFLRAVEVLQQALHGAQLGQKALSGRWILLSLARLYAERDKKDLAREYFEEEHRLALLLRPRVPEEFWASYEEEARRRASINEGMSLAALLDETPAAFHLAAERPPG